MEYDKWFQGFFFLYKFPFSNVSSTFFYIFSGKTEIPNSFILEEKPNDLQKEIYNYCHSQAQAQLKTCKGVEEAEAQAQGQSNYFHAKNKPGSDSWALKWG